jgi:hypothetical protein
MQGCAAPRLKAPRSRAARATSASSRALPDRTASSRAGRRRGCVSVVGTELACSCRVSRGEQSHHQFVVCRRPFGFEAASSLPEGVPSRAYLPLLQESTLPCNGEPVRSTQDSRRRVRWFIAFTASRERAPSSRHTQCSLHIIVLIQSWRRVLLQRRDPWA